MGYYKQVDVFSQVEEPDREGVVLLSSKLMTVTIREWLTIVFGLSLSLITNVGLIFWIARLYSV